MQCHGVIVLTFLTQRQCLVQWVSWSSVSLMESRANGGGCEPTERCAWWSASVKGGGKEEVKDGATECTTGCSYSPHFMLQADLAKSSSRMLGLGALTVEWTCWLPKPCQKCGFQYFSNEIPPPLEAQMQHLCVIWSTNVWGAFGCTSIP